MKRKKRSIIYLIVSLLLHTVFLLLFAFLGFRRLEFLLITPSAAMQQKQEELARLRPKFSDGGKQTVVFLEEPPTIPITKQEPIKKAAIPAPQQPATQKTIPLKHAPVEKPKTIIEHTRPLQKPLEIKKLALANLLKQHNQENQKKTPQQTAALPEQPPIEKKKTIFSLPTCTIDSPNGNSSMTRDGVEKFPGLEDMKFLSYEQRLQDHYLNTWKMYFAHDRNPTSHSPQPCSIYVVINEDGHLDDIVLQKSSGNSYFDRQVVECYKKAAPFPPIPKHFGIKKYYPRGCTIHLPSY